MQEQEYFCPSFSIYSTNRVAEIAVKVSDEINVDGAGSEEDFEFSFDRQIQPVFNSDVLLNDVSYDVDRKGDSSVQVSLKDLFLEDRETMSSSSSEVDELESVPAGTYCVWKPSPSRCKKSNSTGSAFKRWSIRDLMRRSNSEGKDSFVFLTPEKGMKNETSKAKESSEAKDKASSSRSVYLRNQAAAKDKRKSYLPYRQGKCHPKCRDIWEDISGISVAYLHGADSEVEKILSRECLAWLGAKGNTIVLDKTKSKESA